MCRCSLPIVHATPPVSFTGLWSSVCAPYPHDDVVRAVQITSRFPAVHGAPIHVGDPAVLGIRDVQRPDFGDAVPMAPGEVPVFWACGVTPQAVVMHVKPELAMTHAPGHMFISDRRNSALAVL